MCASVAGHMGLGLRRDGQARAELGSHGEKWDLKSWNSFTEKRSSGSTEPGPSCDWSLGKGQGAMIEIKEELLALGGNRTGWGWDASEEMV